MKTYRLREQQHEDLLEDMLLARGVEGGEAAAQFLEPNFERDSHDPFLLPDMEVAVDRILAAVKRNESVAVWSDYDCDGIPGGVLLSEFLRGIGLAVHHYIPHRHAEGYGMNEKGIEELAEAGIKLIITVDLGTTEHEPIAFANKKAIDVIVTDHHLVSKAEELPPALAVINPKRPDSRYPFDGLCGAGVAWKLVQAMLVRNRFGIGEGQEKWLLDLAGLGTLSDMVPLVGENRMIASCGLIVMRRARRPGLAALLAALKIAPATLSEDDVGFMVAPRINAASRMDSPDIAARLLTTNSMVEARELAARLNTINDARKGLVAGISREVNKRLESLGVESPLIVMGNPSWRPGVLGLVANTLMQAHGGPVFLWGRDGSEPSTEENGLLRGSCRSNGSVSVVDLMAAAGKGNFFDHFGGHRASGGFSLTQEKAHELPARLARAYEALYAGNSLVEEVMLDRQLDVAEVPHAHRALQKLAPFGIGNTKPLFIFPNTSIASVRTFGKNKDHLELQFATSVQDPNSQRIPGVAFFSNPNSFQKKVGHGVRADIIGHVETDWRGGPRIRIVDVL
jgi:single-stranded-DNA-specific exonuclease